MNRLVIAVTFLALAVPSHAQETEAERRIADISRTIALDLLGHEAFRNPVLSDSTAATYARAVRDAGNLPSPLRSPVPDRSKTNRTILRNIGKGVAIVVILLGLRWVIELVGVLVGGESARRRHESDRRLRLDLLARAAVVPIPNVDEGRRVGSGLVERRLAARAIVTDAFPALHHQAEKEARQAYLVLVTRRHRLKRIRKALDGLLPEHAPVFAFSLRHGYKPQMRALRRAVRRFRFA